MPATTRSFIALGGALVALTAAPAASAKTYCVAKPECETAGGIHANSVKDAIDLAQASLGEADRIELGPGTFTRDTGWQYAGSGGPLAIVGSGRGTTTLSGPPTTAASSFFVLTLGGTSSSVSDLDLRSPDGDDPDDARFALVTDGTAQRIGVTERSDDDIPPLFFGVNLSEGATLRDSTITSRGAPNSSGVGIGNGGGNVDNVVVRGADFGVFALDNAKLSRLDIQAGRAGMQAIESTVSITNSLLRAPSGVVASPAKVSVANTTMVASSAGGSGAEARTDGANFKSDVTVDSSIVRGFERSLAYGGAANGTKLTVRNSDFDAATVLSLGSTSTLDLTTGNVDANPLFIDPTAGDFRLGPGSPAIDRGNPQPLGVAPDPTDLAGAPRPLDGDGLNGAQPDMGAYEAPAVTLPSPIDPVPPPVPPATPDKIAPAITAPGLSARRFRVASGKTATSAATPKGTKIRFTLSEASTVSLRIDKASRGRRSGKKCSTRAKRGKRCTAYKAAGTLTRKLKAGKATVPFTGRIGSKALKPGGYRLSLTARDAAGNRSKARTVAFTVVR